eukprot:5755821-Pyramimonas_sp.AAC.1
MSTPMSARPSRGSRPFPSPSFPASLPVHADVHGCGRGAVLSPRDARWSPRRDPGDARGSSAARSRESASWL